jgi:hypothetical protein
VLHNALQEAVNQLRAGCKSGKSAKGKKKK